MNLNDAVQTERQEHMRESEGKEDLGALSGESGDALNSGRSSVRTVGRNTPHKRLQNTRNSLRMTVTSESGE